MPTREHLGFRAGDLIVGKRAFFKEDLSFAILVKQSDVYDDVWNILFLRDSDGNMLKTHQISISDLWQWYDVISRSE